MLTAFDVGVALLVLISALLATARGLTREVLSLATWAGSGLFAVWMYLNHREIALGYIREEIVADITTVIVSFVGALIILHLLTMRIADFVVDSKIGPLDRSLGFVFGGLRGILIAVVIVIFGQWLSWFGLSNFVDGSRSIPMLTSLGDSLIEALPEELEQQVTNIVRGDDAGAAPLPDALVEETDAGEDGSLVNA